MTKTPWHLLLIGALSLLWNLPSAADFVLINLGADFYTTRMSAEQTGYFDAFPFWANAAWGIGALAAVLGSVLLLARSGRAVASFLISLVAMLIMVAYTLGLAEVTVADLMGPVAALMSVAIVIVAAFLLWYSRRMRILGHLR